MKIITRISGGLLIGCLILIFSTGPLSAQAVPCYFQPVSIPLNDLGSNEYVRLDGTHTGVSGGLYLNGLNNRPQEHETAGVALASTIQPLNAAGQPDPNGLIGLVSIGMSNNRQEFDTFRRLFDSPTDPYYFLNPRLKVVSGSSGGGVLERWSDPSSPYYDQYWSTLFNEVALAGLTIPQVQSVWIKTTEYDYLHTYPENVEQYARRMKDLVRLVHQRLPNVKIAYISSRTRAHAYHIGNLNPEPYSFETGLAVRQVILDQINGDATLNFNPASGPVVAPYLSWGPYLWIDGDNPRADGRTWPVSFVSPQDCVHPEQPAKDAVAAMLWEFFTSDSTATPWFRHPNSPPPISVSPTIIPTDLDSDGDFDIFDFFIRLVQFLNQSVNIFNYNQTLEDINSL